jgi:hypothetical protein
MLPPPVELRQPVIEPSIPNSNLPYDIIVTTNVPPSQMLKMVERAGAGWRVKNYA